MYMFNSKKTQGSIAVVVAVVLTLIAFFGLYECSRLSELKNNLPEYVIKETEQEAAIAAVVLAAINNDVYIRAIGSSNSLYLPFENTLA